LSDAQSVRSGAIAAGGGAAEGRGVLKAGKIADA